MKIRAVGVVAFILAAAGFAFGCSSKDVNSEDAASGRCPVAGTQTCPEEAVDSANNAACVKKRADKTCGKAFITQLKCAGLNVSCGSDGKIEVDKLNEACKDEVAAYNLCLTNAAAAGGSDAGTGRD